METLIVGPKYSSLSLTISVWCKFVNMWIKVTLVPSSVNWTGIQDNSCDVPTTAKQIMDYSNISQILKYAAICPVWYGQISFDKTCKSPLWRKLQFAGCYMGWYSHRSQYQCPRALKCHGQRQRHCRIKTVDTAEASDAAFGYFDILLTRTSWKYHGKCIKILK